MTAPSPDTIERERLYVTDDELIRRLGVRPSLARAIIRDFDETASGFPQKQKLWGDRRYWPAVKAYFDRMNGLESGIDAARLAAEHPHRSGLPRRPHAEPLRRAINHD